MTRFERDGTNAVTLEGLLADSAVELNLAGSSKGEVIEQLLERLDRAGAVADRHQVLFDLQARERQGSTALGRGLALPHAKSSGVYRPALAFGRCPVGVDFDALDGKPVHLIFLLVIPRWQAGLHLRVLSALNRFLRDKDNRRQLLTAPGEARVRQLLQGVVIP